MPPRHTYWTILIDDQPTAFRAHDPEELLPTLNRLREKNQTAVMKWFERGQLFDSRDQARDAGLGQGERRWEGPRPDRSEDGGARGTRRSRQDEGGRATRPAGPAARGDRPAGPAGRGDRPRDKNWRPGGEHRDPRQKYKDAKKAKWNRFKDKIRERHEERAPRDPEQFTPPHGDKLRDAVGRPAARPSRAEPRDRKPRAAWGPGPAAKPHGDTFDRPEWRRDDDRPRPSGPAGDRERRPWSDRPPRREDGREQRPWSDRPPRRDGDREERPWSNRPPRRDGGREQRPWNDRPPRRDGDRDQRPSSDRPPRRDGDREQRPWSNRPPRREGDREQRPWSDRPPRRESDRDRRPAGDRPPRRDDDRGDRSSSRSRTGGGGAKPRGPEGWKPAGGPARKPWAGKPAPGGARKPWGAKPPGGARKPWASKPGGRGPAAGRAPKRRKDDE